MRDRHFKIEHIAISKNGKSSALCRSLRIKIIKQREKVMKKFFRTVLLVISLMLILSMLAACNGNDETEAPTDGPTEAPTDDPNLHSIFADGEYKLEFVKPKYMSEVDENAVDMLASMLKSKTGVAPTFVDDSTAVNGKAMYVGNVSYSQSETQYIGLNYGEGVVKTIATVNVVIAYTDGNAAEELIDALGDAIQKNGGNYTLAKTFTYKIENEKSTLELPEYSGGTKGEPIDCGQETKMTVIKKSNKVDFEEYLIAVETAGFDIYGDVETISDNIFATFVDEDTYHYIYFMGKSGDVRIVTGPVATLAPLEEANVTNDAYAPKLTAVGQIAGYNCGQGYIVTLPDGRFIIHDGGDKHKSKPDYIYEALKELAHNPDNIVVAAWYISHPHDDHQNAFEEFVANHAEDVKVETVVYNYMNAAAYDFSRGDGTTESGSRFVNSIEACAKKLNARVIKAHTGQTLYYGSVSIEIIYTVEDYLPNQFNYINSTSLVIRIKAADTTVMMLADTTHESGSVVEYMWGDYLKSDMVQIAHHGMWSSNASLYKCINADVVLWPQVEEHVKQWLTDPGTAAALENASDVYLSGTGLVTIDLDYVIKNNKAEFLDKYK